MSRRKTSYMPTPRVVTSPAQVANFLGRSEEWFRQRRETLEADGFPLKDGLLDGWDIDAINAWLDKRAGLGQHLSPESMINPCDEVFGIGQSEHTIYR
jgi:hypothetical protein